MRIISGSCKGRIITPPKNLKARPTTDFAKENLFNVLNNAIDLEDISVLDLFSGSGSISFEFASRGAAKVVSVEKDAIHHRFIKQNSAKLGLDSILAVHTNVFVYLKSCKEQYDLIFADPPYDLEGIEQLPDMIIEHNLLKDDAIFIFEHSKSKNFSDHPNFYQLRTYGSVNFSFFKKVK